MSQKKHAPLWLAIPLANPSPCKWKANTKELLANGQLFTDHILKPIYNLPVLDGRGKPDLKISFLHNLRYAQQIS